MTQLRQGPWTDLYALGAVIHYLLFGVPPAPATARAVQDDGDAIEQPHRSRRLAALHRSDVVDARDPPEPAAAKRRAAARRARRQRRGPAARPAGHHAARQRSGARPPKARRRSSRASDAIPRHQHGLPADLHADGGRPGACRGEADQLQPGDADADARARSRSCRADPATGAVRAGAFGPATATVPMAQRRAADHPASRRRRPCSRPRRWRRRPSPPASRSPSRSRRPPPAARPDVRAGAAGGPARPAGATSAARRRAAPVASGSKAWSPPRRSGSIGVVALAFVAWQYLGRPTPAPSIARRRPPWASPAAPASTAPARCAWSPSRVPGPSTVLEAADRRTAAAGLDRTPATAPAPAAPARRLRRARPSPMHGRVAPERRRPRGTSPTAAAARSARAQPRASRHRVSSAGAWPCDGIARTPGGPTARPRRARRTRNRPASAAGRDRPLDPGRRRPDDGVRARARDTSVDAHETAADSASTGVSLRQARLLLDGRLHGRALRVAALPRHAGMRRHPGAQERAGQPLSGRGAARRSGASDPGLRAHRRVAPKCHPGRCRGRSRPARLYPELCSLQLRERLLATRKLRGARGSTAPGGLAQAPAARAGRARDLPLVQPRSRGDALPRPGRLSLLRTCPELPPAARRRDRAGRLAAARRRREGRPGRGLHAELPAVPDRLLCRPARRRGGRSGQPDEPRGGVQALHRRPGHEGRDLQRRPGRHRRHGERSRCPKASASARSSSRATATRCRPARSARPTRRRRRWRPGCAPIRRCRRAARPGTTRSPSSSHPARTRPRSTTSRSCPTPRAPPACPRAACTPIAR